MDNNDDHFKHSNNRPGLGMRDLLALLADKAPGFYYSDVLVENGHMLKFPKKSNANYFHSPSKTSAHWRS